MKYLYTYYNKKVGDYEVPIFSPNVKEDQIRLVRRMCLVEPQIAKEQHHLDECDLYLLGTYHEEKGSFELFEKPEFLVSLDQFFVKEIKANV